jgi:hypothetical protein
VDLLAVDANLCAPFRAVSINAFEPRPVAPADIAHILGMGRLAQIRNAVVRRILVLVIDLSGRVLPMDIKPGEPMGVVDKPVDPDDDIPTRAMFACLRPGARTASRHAPIKKPRFRGAVKQFAQPLGAEAELPFTEHDGGLSKKKSARRPIRAPGAMRVSDFSQLQQRTIRGF